MTSESVEPSMSGYRSGSTAIVSSRRRCGQSAMKPLCTNSHLPCLNGWQFVCCTGMPELAARTWARNSGERICALSSRRFWSPHAGRELRNSPGVSLRPYHPRPNPSAFAMPASGPLRRLCSISDRRGS